MTANRPVEFWLFLRSDGLQAFSATCKMSLDTPEAGSRMAVGKPVASPHPDLAAQKNAWPGITPESSPLLTSLPLIMCLGAGLVGGVFFAFSAFIMKALGQLPSGQGVAAMQRINVAVLSPVFLGVFVGSAVMSGICVFAAFFPWGETRSFLLLVAGLAYLVGCFGVTAAFNVPRNERLARMEADSDLAAAYWPVYVREWLLWNHVRTAASFVCAACASAALAS